MLRATESDGGREPVFPRRRFFEHIHDAVEYLEALGLGKRRSSASKFGVHF